MKNRQRILFVTELFYPEESATAYVLSKVASWLAREFEIRVITGPASYESTPHKDSRTQPVVSSAIWRTWAPELNKNSLLGRLALFLLLTVGMSWQFLYRSRRTDIVLAVTNPAPMLVALAVFRKFRPFRLAILVHDIFPENAVAAGMISGNNCLYRLSRAVFNWAYGSADAVITIGRDMSEVLSRKITARTDKITLIENWADSPLVKRIPREQSLIPRMGLSAKIVIQYAGNIGRAQGLLEFVELVSAVENDRLRFVFRGSGALSSALHEATQGRTSFVLAGPYSRSEQALVLGSCDIAVVILGPDMYGLGVPSKIYNILAAGKPVLFLGPKDSEVYRLIISYNIGWAFDWSEADKLIAMLSQLSFLDLRETEVLGNKARWLAETVFTEAGQLAKFSALFHNLQSTPIK